MPDLNKIGKRCDSLVAAGLHAQAANLYFNAANDLGNSELYVYAGWQFGEANMKDSAFISIRHAIRHGMSNPHVLEAYQLAGMKDNSAISKALEHELDSIGQALHNLSHFDFVTEPLDSFWPYFQSAMGDTMHARKYLSSYIRNGSFATKDYYHKRYEHVDNMYKQMIQKTPALYSYARQFLDQHKMDLAKDSMFMMMRRLSDIYPDAVFPKVYLVPGILTGNGTQTESGLFVAAEMFVRSAGMPTEGLTQWQLETIGRPGNMIFVIMHELMHFQQAYSDTINANHVPGKVITEGACDFLVTLLSNDINTLDSIRIEKIRFLNNPAHLDFILSAFKKDLHSKDLSKWMYNGGAIHDRPSDIGYALGYMICKSFYERSENKAAAIKELLTTDNFNKIIAGSEYASGL